MKRRICISMVVCILCFGSVAQALVVQTDFNGLPAGKLQSETGTGVGFSGVWNSGAGSMVAIKGAGNDLIAPAGTYFGLTQSGGSSDETHVGNSLTGYDRMQGRDTAVPLTGTVWGSFLIKLASATSQVGIGFNKGGWAPGPPRIFAIGSMIRLDPPSSTYRVDVPGALVVDQTSLILFRMQIDADGTNDHVTVWANPDLRYIGSQTPIGTQNGTDWVGTGITRLDVISYGVPDDASDMVTLSDDADAYYDVTGIPYDPVSGQYPAYAPGPADGVGQVGTPNGSVVDVDLSWTTGMDPSGVGTYNPDIKEHDLYMSADQNVSNDANLVYVDTIVLTGVDESITVAGLNFDGSYRWRIDEMVDNGAGGTYPTGDPNNITGWVQSFETLLSVPVVTVQPEDVLLDLLVDDTANFAITAESLTTETYQWYHSIDNVVDVPGDTAVGTNANSLSVGPATLADEGYYFCVVTNAGGVDTSAMARLGIKRMMARYSMDETGGYDGSNYLDTNTEDSVANDAALVGVLPPTFVTGADGTANGAVLIDADSVANAGTWNPSELTDQLTVTFWLEWDGINATAFQGAIGKYLNAGEHMWYVKRVGTANYLEFANGLDQHGPDVMLTDDDQWQLVVFAFNGTHARGYVNGIVFQNDSTDENMTLSDGTDAPIWIGKANPDSDGLINGAMDDIRIYNYALTPEDVVDLYNANPALDDIYACLYSINEALDIVDDCKIDLLDFAAIAASWLDCGLYPNAACN